ncbi:MAG: TIGR03862 family flavoprotein [Hyphomicrobiaceae bacterium]|nr:TIGR03862 family flavoprotein [Hyphomicrobiaceae bacterium]
MSHVAIVGGGPAGLMAADVISGAGQAVVVYDRMPSLGRKLLMAGRGGLNLAHSEPLDRQLERYGDARPVLEAAIRAFPPAAVVAFVEALGQPTFVGSSGRIFPRAMKASPLLRAWISRLAGRGVQLRLRHRWLGLDAAGKPRFATPDGEIVNDGASAVVLALGGASWPRLGSDGAWVPVLVDLGVGVTPLTPANAGILLPWSETFAARFAGTPLKRVRVVVEGEHHATGELVVTRSGLEGGAVYAVSAVIARAVSATAKARLEVDLRRDLDISTLQVRLSAPRGKQSVSNWLRKVVGLPPVAIALLREVHGSALPADPWGLAVAIKRLPLTTTGLGSLDRAISTAGGIRLDEVDEHMMLRRHPGILAAGEMLDWEAPTGGYLLQASLATGYAAGKGVLAYLARHAATGSPARSQSTGGDAG